MPTTGTILRSHYKIIKILGSGGFGDTYLAQDLDLPDKPLRVVKHLKPNPDPKVLEIVRRLFDSEAQVLYKLGNDSDQIPRLFAHFEEQGQFYLVQEFVDGEDLSYEIVPGEKLTEIAVIKLLQEILKVLAVVHKNNIIHRDIKPQNIMRRRQDGKIVLIDFGAVKEVEAMTVNSQGQTSLSVAIGSLGYMPSEQAIGRPKLSSDVYAVGMLAIQALTGLQPHELPTDPKNDEVIWRNRANVTEKLALVLNKMVSYDFRDRYPSAVEALQAITAIQPQQQPQIPPTILKPPIVPTILNPVTPSTFFSTYLQTFQFETVKVNAQGQIIKRQNREAKYFVEDLGNGVTLEMVQIPGGTFTMGSPEEEAGRFDNESPQRQVRVPGFFMGRYAVIQEQWQAVMGTNPAHFKGNRRPVEQVSWDDAVEFCEKLSQKTGKTYRLPSEAEWEYACRAGTNTPFYFGETINTDLVNYDGNFPYGSAPKGEYRQQTTDVGKFPPNSFGLYDIHGNVWQWCQDVYNENYQGAPTDGSAWLNGKEKNINVLRGGSWVNGARYCRSPFRVKYACANSPYYVGFRVVAVVA
ncbi:MAG: SUMF1/EgtB/PvdO family nonheme iron enzyme [Trichormus sp. ATA11-4-KO1]|jgi:formylglycine-generating enzyme required for sulfatase activity/tRNA A-37 threonylcarbamoyl transferase component Bud32|nr:SUMF1/EgtB/PvdO family nonheme iron enzyme [Trichormus sp. ATA11-4-KO1]